MRKEVSVSFHLYEISVPQAVRSSWAVCLPPYCICDICCMRGKKLLNCKWVPKGSPIFRMIKYFFNCTLKQHSRFCRRRNCCWKEDVHHGNHRRSSDTLFSQWHWWERKFCSSWLCKISWELSVRWWTMERTNWVNNFAATAGRGSSV